MPRRPDAEENQLEERPRGEADDSSSCSSSGDSSSSSSTSSSKSSNSKRRSPFSSSSSSSSCPPPLGRRARSRLLLPLLLTLVLGDFSPIFAEAARVDLDVSLEIRGLDGARARAEPRTPPNPPTAPTNPSLLWPLLGVSLPFLFWGSYLFAKASDESGPDCLGPEEEKFRNFRKSLNAASTANKFDNWLTMQFSSVEDETRYALGVAPLLCRRLRLLTQMLLLGMMIHLAVRVDVRSTFAAGLGIHLTVSYLSFGGLVTAMLVLSTWGYLEPLNILVEPLVVAWLTLVVISAAFVFLPIFDTAPPDQATSIDYVYCLGFTLYYLCIRTPMRVLWLVPCCVLVPLAFLLFDLALVLPHYPHEGQRGNCLHMAGALCIVAGGGLLAKHHIEKYKRGAWGTSYHSFAVLRKVEEETVETGRESVTSRTQEALGKVILALDALAASSEVSNLSLDLCRAISVAKSEAEYAKLSFQRVDQLYHVSAEEAMRARHAEQGEGMDDMIDFIRATQTETWLKSRCTVADQKVRDSRRATINRSFKSFRAHTMKLEPDVPHNAVAMLNIEDLQLPDALGESFAFNALEVHRRTGGYALLHVGQKIVVSNGLCSELDIDSACFEAWLREVHSRYQVVPYHGESHGAQVCALTAVLANDSGWSSKADDLQAFALYVAALSHDMGHFGRNNLFCTKLEHPAALIWNDLSTLENMHSALCFAVMRGDADLLHTLPYIDQVRLRKAVIRFILSTDIKDHHSSLARLDARIKAGYFLQVSDNAFAEDVESKYEEDVLLAGETLIKTGDIGHGLMPWATHREWSYRVSAEFFAQGDEERNLGLPISPLCDRTAKTNMAGSQAFFIDVFSSAVMEAILGFAQPGAEVDKLKSYLENGQTNKEMWKAEVHLDPLTLSLDILEENFGKADPEPRFPYPFDVAELALITRKSPPENLKDLVGEDRFQSYTSIQMSSRSIGKVVTT